MSHLPLEPLDNRERDKNEPGKHAHEREQAPDGDRCRIVAGPNKPGPGSLRVELRKSGRQHVHEQDKPDNERDDIPERDPHRAFGHPLMKFPIRIEHLFMVGLFSGYINLPRKYSNRGFMELHAIA